MRINLYIAKSGFCSRRDADKHILAGNVQLNSQVWKNPGYDVKTNDVIAIFGKVISIDNNKLVYYLMNKPKDCICTNKDTHHRRTYLDLMKNEDVVNKNIFTVGRLDRDTTGVLLITNDGDLYNLLLHPRNHVKKEYLADCRKLLTEKELTAYKKGLILKNGVKTQPCTIKLVSKKYDYASKRECGKYLIILKEGKKNQIHLCFKHFNTSLKNLERIKFAGLTIHNIAIGKYRLLTAEELKSLKQFN